MEVERFSSFKTPNFGANAPTEFLVLKWGHNPTKKGPIYLTEKSAQMIMDRYKKNGRKLIFDLDHASADPSVPPQYRKAVGYFEPEVRADGLWASNISWTSEIEDEIQKGNWGWFSPDLMRSSLGVVKQLNCIALTNSPAMQKLEPILLSDNTMNQKTLPSEALMTKIRPLRDLQSITESLMTAVQYAMGTYPNSPVSILSEKMTTQLPDWIEEIAEMIEMMDPEGETEMNTETKPTPVVEQTDQKKESPDAYSELLSFCQELTGKKDIDEMKGILRSYKHNQKTAEQRIALSEKREQELLVEAAIKEGKISEIEKREYLSLSKKELHAFLSNAMPITDSFVAEKPMIASSRPLKDEQIKEYEEAANQIFSRVKF